MAVYDRSWVQRARACIKLSVRKGGILVPRGKMGVRKCDFILDLKTLSEASWSI